MNINYKNIEFSFYPRKTATNKSGKCSLYCAIQENKEIITAPFSTNIKVSSDKWNSKLKTTEDEFKDIISAEINQLENVLRQIKFNLQMTEKEVSAKMIKETFLKITRKKAIKTEKVQKYTLVKTILLYIKRSEELGVSNRTILNSISIKNNIEKFLKSINKVNMLVSEVDFEFIDSFFIWLKNDSKFSINHSNRHLSFIRRVLDFAIIKKQIKSNPIQSVKFKGEEKLDPIGLSSIEIKQLQNACKLTDLEQISVDIFLFMCGSGIDHIDYNNLTISNLIQKKNTFMLKYERIKTKKHNYSKVCEANPILKECALAIIHKYGGIQNLPKISTTQVINRKIQSVAKAIGIKTHLTTKRARKTYANICINEENNSDEQTAYQLGHVKTDKLKHYRRYNDNILNNLIK